MKNLTRNLAAATLLVAGTALVTTQVVGASTAPSAPQDQGHDMPGMDPEMMAKMMALATPGKEHAAIMERAGEWSIDYKFRMSPQMPWMEAKGTGSAKPILDGRYLMEEHRFEMMGMPMHGILLLGYDNEAKESISLWMDTTSTWWVEARGQTNAAGVSEMRGTMKDVAGKRPYRMKVMPPAADGSVEHEMYDTIDGKEVHVMSYTARRKQG